MKHLILFSVFLLSFPALHAQDEGTVTGMAWNGSTWLIVGYWSNASHLLEYNGKTFHRVKEFEKFRLSLTRQIIWNYDNNYWVVTGHRDDDAILIMYDGKKLEEIARVHSYCTGDLAWDGKNYLMVVCGSAMVGETGYVKLSENGSITESIQFYWGYGRIFHDGERIFTSNGTTLFVYTGETFEKFSELPIGIKDMDTSGSYWIICGFDKLLAFNSTYYRPITIGEGCDKIEWGNRYWLIAKDGQLVKYDGRKLIPIENIPKFETITAVKWNGDYWLIGGRDFDASPKLVKYDGLFFEDLTEKMLRTSLQKTVNQTIEKSQISLTEDRKTICGPTSILLLPILLFSARRYFSII